MQRTALDTRTSMTVVDHTEFRDGFGRGSRGHPKVGAVEHCDRRLMKRRVERRQRPGEVFGVDQAHRKHIGGFGEFGSVRGALM